MPEPAVPTPATNTAALSRRIRRYAWLLLVLAIVLAAWGEISRVMARAELGRQAEDAGITTVETVAPHRTSLGEELVLPGTVQAFKEAPIYARTSGYLKNWYTDIGTPVKAGQLLAEIETPEIDQQLTQALADLETARANQTLADSTNVRWQALLATESVSKQDADQKAGDAAAKRAAVASAAANVARLRDLTSFKRVLAPFDGVVTSRSTDVGALINAGQAAGTDLFHVADTRRLRIYVQVPESYAAATRPGLPAELHFAGHPGKTYLARTMRTSNALDPALRTLQVELQLDNPRHEVLPGAYAEAHFKLPGDASSLRLPSNVILFRAAGLQVATVDRNQRVKLKSILQGRDFGATIEVLDGLAADDVVVVNPPDSLIDGAIVRAVAAPAT
jgi:RND family efflux transporter MFP subunit